MTQLSRRISLPRRSAAAAAPTAGSHERLVLPVAVLAAVVVALVGWLLLVSPLREDTASVRAQTATVDTQVATLRSQLADLQAAQANLPRLQADLQAARAALPTTAALPAFLRTLQDLGTRTGTVVTALDATEPDGSTGGVTTGAGSVGDVYQVPITVTVTGAYDGLTAFVAALQQTQPRAVLIGSVSESAADGGSTTLTITMTAFVAPTAGATGNGG